MIRRQPLTCCRLLTSTRSPTKTAAPCSTRPIQTRRIQETACYFRRLPWTARSLESGSGRSRKTLLQFPRTTSRNSSGLRPTPSTRPPTATENSLARRSYRREQRSGCGASSVAGQINCRMRQELWLQQSSGQKSFIFDRKWSLGSELIRLFTSDGNQRINLRRPPRRNPTGQQRDKRQQ